MKRTFTKDYILENKGCYSESQVLNLPFINQKKITINTLLNNLPFKDFNWFLLIKCELTNRQKQDIALMYAEIVLPIYEKKYPKDKRIMECIERTKEYLKGTCTRKHFLEKRRAASDAASDAADDDSYCAAAYYAADSADYVYAAAAADVADVAGYTYYAADSAYCAAAAADAAYRTAAAAEKSFINQLKKSIREWLKN